MIDKSLVLKIAPSRKRDLNEPSVIDKRVIAKFVKDLTRNWGKERREAGEGEQEKTRTKHNTHTHTHSHTLTRSHIHSLTRNNKYNTEKLTMAIVRPVSVLRHLYIISGTFSGYWHLYI